MQPASAHPPGTTRPPRWNRARRVVAAALAAAFAVLLPASVTSAWIRGTILSTSGYVAAVTPVAASPVVRAAVQDAVTSQVDAADANRLAHSQLISVLNGDNALVTATGGEVVLNLLPLVNDVLHTVSGPLSAMTGGAVSLPPVTAIPAAACHAITGTVSSRISGCLLLLHRKATNSSSATSKALTLPEYRYRLRVGDYRVLYEVIDGQLIILVVGVGHRRESTG